MQVINSKTIILTQICLILKHRSFNHNLWPETGGKGQEVSKTDFYTLSKSKRVTWA